MENNKNKKSVKFQGDVLNFCDFIQVFVFTRNHHLNHDCFKLVIESLEKSPIAADIMFGVIEDDFPFLY